MQSLFVDGVPNGGTFTLTTSAPLPIGTTPPIPFNATAAQVQAALQTIIPAGDVSVTVGPVNTPGGVTITFEGLYASEAIPNLIATNDLIGGINPSDPDPDHAVRRQSRSATRSLISSVPNSVTAIDGNNAQVRVIIDGSQIKSSSPDRLCDQRVQQHRCAGWPSKASPSASRFPIQETSAT